MNALYGYPLVGSAALGALGQNEDEGKIALLWDIATGTSKKRLEVSKRKVEKMDENMNKLRSKLNRMKEGIEKTNFFVVYKEANQKVIDLKKKLNMAIQDHNKLSAMISKVTLGKWNPGRVGLAQPIVFTVAVATILVAGAFFISSLSSWFNGERGLFATANNAIDKADSIVKNIPKTIIGVGDTAIKISLAVGGILIAYVVYKNVKNKKSSSISLMKQIPVKIAA